MKRNPDGSLEFSTHLKFSFEVRNFADASRIAGILRNDDGVIVQTLSIKDVETGVEISKLSGNK